MLKSSLLVLALVLPSLAHAGSPCADKTKEGEDFIDNGDNASAIKALEAAVKECRKSGDKSARPFIALGKAYFSEKRYQDSTPLFEEALTKEPGLQLAYMNLGAAYMEMEQFDKAISWLGKGLAEKQQSKDWTMKLNYNMGLAYFKLAASKNDEKDTRSEPYFKKASELGPSFGGSFFYLGVLAEVAKKDKKAAMALYKQGCDKDYQQACQFMQGIDQRMASAGAASGAPAAMPALANPNAKLSKDNEAKLAKLQAGYKKMGADKATIDSVSANMRNACAQAGEAACTQMLDGTLASLPK